LRHLILNKTGQNKVRSQAKELKAGDFESSVKSCHPGEWCLLQVDGKEHVGYINPLVGDQFTCFYLIEHSGNQTDPVLIVKDKLERAYGKRSRLEGYLDGCRLFYGSSDGLPGLIIDTFLDTNIIQINTAGIDKYREEIRSFVSELTKKKSYFLDNVQYRSKEFLPSFEKENIQDLSIIENNLKYKLRSEVLQKVGFYYDHRENRRQLTRIMNSLNFTFNSGIDLFSYIGAWGINALSAGCKEVDFVDQGDFSTEVSWSLQKNSFEGRGHFHRTDVFKFLDEKIKADARYDLILSDPPAFAKSMNQKKQALEGYSKLHRKVFKLASKGSLCAFSSCTHYVTHEEFMKNIQETAFRENKKIQLIYTGIQGWDHPISSLNDRANYIKSYFYFVE